MRWRSTSWGTPARSSRTAAPRRSTAAGNDEPQVGRCEMAVVAMTILSPLHGDVVVGPKPVTFAAVLGAGGHGPGTLFARWYSTLPSVPGEPPALTLPPDL